MGRREATPSRPCSISLARAGRSYSWERRKHGFLASKPHVKVVPEYHNIGYAQEERPWHRLGWDL